ncbi:MAG: hypothetical protein K9N06_12275 [Candidatus Cloacimonetes bacterium]|nr:hypothetical protein [Candidatus Cloacimonadota bacterium]
MEDQFGNYPSESNIDYSCWITARPGEARDFGSTGCDYSSTNGFISINIGNFSQWNDTETLHVVVSLSNVDGGPWIKEETIDEDAPGDLQYYLFPSNGLQCGTYETETAVLTDDSEVEVSFDYSEAADVLVKVKPAAALSVSIPVRQFDGARTSIPNNSKSLPICFDVDDANVSTGHTVDYTFTWNAPAPSGTSGQLVVTFNGGDTWQDVTAVANFSILGWDLAGNSTYGKTYGVKVQRTYASRHEADASYAFGDGEGTELLQLSSVQGAAVTTVTKNTPADYDVTLSWAAVAGATNYKIKYCDTYAGGTYSYYQEGGTDFVTTNTYKVLQGWSGNGFNNIDRANFIKIEACHDTYTNNESDIIAFREYNNNINSYLPSNCFISLLFDNSQLYTTASALGDALGNVDIIGQWDGDSWDTCQKIHFPDWYPIENSYWWLGDFNLNTNKPIMVTAEDEIKAFFSKGSLSDARHFNCPLTAGAAALEDNLIIIPMDSSIYSDSGWETNTGDALYSGLQKLAQSITDCTKIEKWNKNTQAWRVLSITDTSWGDERWEVASDNDVLPGSIYRVQVSSSSTWSCAVIGE